MRLDKYLTEQNPGLSRTRASNLIELGKVVVNGNIVFKQSFNIGNNDIVLIIGDYDASLGGIKLSHALREFGAEVAGKVCLDVGASNGGFTDVLLKNSSDMVYALDVGECALPDYLKNDNRVVVMDKTNARFITKDNFNIQPSFAVIDVSFISLTLLIGEIAGCLTDNGEIIALIKPQFECSKKDLTKKGIVTDAKKRAIAVKKIEDFCIKINLEVVGIIAAPHPFADKNQEYLIYLKKKKIA